MSGKFIGKGDPALLRLPGQGPKLWVAQLQDLFTGKPLPDGEQALKGLLPLISYKYLLHGTAADPGLSQKIPV